MGGGKLPPRQKMIGMMYLVYTALLALNVSKEILDSFVTINEGLEKTVTSFQNKNSDLFAQFEASYQENAAKVAPFYNAAQEVRKSADAASNYINRIKLQITAKTQGVDTSEVFGKDEFDRDTILQLRRLEAKDNLDIGTTILVGSEPAKPREDEFSAYALKMKLESFRDLAASKVDSTSAIYQGLYSTFDFTDQRESGNTGTLAKWETFNFYGVPVAASMAMLTKIQTDIKNFESDVVKYLYAEVDAASYKFNVLESAVISPSNYIIQGDTFKANVFLAAFDSTKNPQVLLGEKYDSIQHTVSGDSIHVVVEQGKGWIKIPANVAGDYTYNGVIKYRAPSGDINNYPFKIKYKVAKPSTTISATKMNVFYLGLDNPVDISAPGVAKDQIRASVTNGSMIKSGAGWIVRPSKIGNSTVNVTADVDGTSQRMGSMEFRVKQVPTPTATIGGKSAGVMRTAALGAISGIRANMDNFAFDVSVVVSSYTFSYIQANGLINEVKVNGNRFTPDVTSKFKGLSRNSKIFFENIKVNMPDGTTRTLPPVNFKIL